MFEDFLAEVCADDVQLDENNGIGGGNLDAVQIDQPPVPAGDFPAPVKVGRNNYFLERELEEWVEARAEARDCGGQWHETHLAAIRQNLGKCENWTQPIKTIIIIDEAYIYIKKYRYLQKHKDEDPLDIL